MNKSNYITRPLELEKHKTGVHIVRFGIEEVTRTVPGTDEEGNMTEVQQTSYDCYELFVENGSEARSTEAAINALWGNGVEQKLVNDYLAAKEGIITGAKATEAKAAYKQFLAERKLYKEQIDAAYANYVPVEEGE